MGELDPIAEARRKWVEHGWDDAADGMALAEREVIGERWHPFWGDRQQDLLIVGCSGLTEAADRLDACLLDDRELSAGEDAWATMNDPLPPSPAVFPARGHPAAAWWCG